MTDRGEQIKDGIREAQSDIVGVRRGWSLLALIRTLGSIIHVWKTGSGTVFREELKGDSKRLTRVDRKFPPSS